jgi:hypothetical protein
MELGKTCACRQIGHNQMPNLTACLPHSAAAEAQCKRDIQDLRDRKVHRLEDRIRSMVWYGCVQMVCARVHAWLFAAARKTEQSRRHAADCSVFVSAPPRKLTTALLLSPQQATFNPPTEWLVQIHANQDLLKILKDKVCELYKNKFCVL